MIGAVNGNVNGLRPAHVQRQKALLEMRLEMRLDPARGLGCVG